jgi:hypothetical protein
MDRSDNDAGASYHSDHNKISCADQKYLGPSLVESKGLEFSLISQKMDRMERSTCVRRSLKRPGPPLWNVI